jgi:hypothetical protein
MMNVVGKSIGNVAFAAVSLLVTLAAFALGARCDVQHQSFKAFYCAGVAVRERHDPYRVEPLRSCERSLERDAMPPGYVEPAPLPGYVLLPFAILSKLPPKVAAELFCILLALAAIASARCLAAATNASATAILLAFAPLTLLNVAYGETAPLAMLAICAAAYFLTKHRWIAAGCAASLALLQPNVGVPAVVAMFLFVHRSRAAVIVSVAAMALLSLAALGLAENREYFAQLLPSMAYAELVASDQYSLSRLLFVVGVAPPLALLLGKIWFACAAVFGIALAGVLSGRRGQHILVPLLPPAAVLFFGVYLHDIQILIALPAALAIASRVPARAFRVIGTAALALLVAVWTQKISRATVVLDVVGVFGGLFAVLGGSLGRRLALASIGAVATTLCVVLLVHLQPGPSAGQIVTHAFGASPDEFSSAAWARYLRATAALTRPAFAPQLAAWLGLLGLLVSAVAMAFRPSDTSTSLPAQDYARPILIA